MQILETKRLLLRTCNKHDLQVMFDINQNPQVMEYFPSLQDLTTTKNLLAKIMHQFDTYGYSWYACISKEHNIVIGFIGLMIADFSAHFTPATEIGWRLDSKYWYQGYATEGATAILDYAFNTLNLPEIVSFTAKNNIKSIKVMQKIGLQYSEKDDFDHPKLEINSPLRRHVLYRLSKEEYCCKNK